jgi:hypothetical protein
MNRWCRRLIAIIATLLERMSAGVGRMAAPHPRMLGPQTGLLEGIDHIALVAAGVAFSSHRGPVLLTTSKFLTPGPFGDGALLPRALPQHQRSAPGGFPVLGGPFKHLLKRTTRDNQALADAN